MSDEMFERKHWATAVPTRPDLRKHVAALRDEGMSDSSAHAYQEARQALADAAEGLLDEIDRISAAPTRPTREQVRAVIEGVMSDGGTDRHSIDDDLTDAVMALIGGDDA